jgi:hypothetical protein
VNGNSFNSFLFFFGRGERAEMELPNKGQDTLIRDWKWNCRIRDRTLFNEAEMKFPNKGQDTLLRDWK